MSKSIIIPALCLIVAIAGLAAIVGANLDENWDPMHKLDEIGNPAAQQTSKPPYGPAAARLTSSQFERQNSSANASEQANTTEYTEQAPAVSIDLKNISAMPNPTNPGSPVEITAIFGDVENMTAHAIIKNSMGVQVGNVALDRSTGGEYMGTWIASIAADMYNADIVASAPGISKTFNNALKIEVLESSNATSSISSGSTYTKLG